MREEPGHAADRAFLAVPVEDRHVAFGRGVELDDPRDPEALLELRPDVGTQAVAAGEAQLVRALLRMRRRVDEIAAELADILQQRALPAHHVVPELAGGEALADHHRAALEQQRAGGEHAAGGVVQRQAVIHAVAGARVHDRGEGVGRKHQPVVVDVGGLGQAGGARRVDEERAVLDGQRAAFVVRERRAGQVLDLAVDARKVGGGVAVQPDLGVAT